MKIYKEGNKNKIMANIEITFLGTSSMIPTTKRNVQGIYIEYEGEGILVDCGEGTQRQMAIAGISRTKVKKILISHWHGDHVSGLVGLIQTIGHSKENSELEVYGPVGTKIRMKHIMQSCIFYNKVNIKIFEINPEKNPRKEIKVYETNKYKINALLLEHSVPCLGYRFVEKDTRKIDMKKAQKYGLKSSPEIGKLQKGKIITVDGKKIKPDDISEIKKGKVVAFILDTKVCNNCALLAKNADLLICECVYAGGMEELAEKYKHMTASQVVHFAKKTGVKKLILTHFSQRYKDINDVLKDAKKIFKNTEAAEDFMKIIV